MGKRREEEEKKRRGILAFRAAPPLARPAAKNNFPQTHNGEIKVQDRSPLSEAIFVPRVHPKFVRLTWPRVRTCLRVQELKKLCFYLLSFLRYEAKSNDDSSFSQF